MRSRFFHSPEDEEYLEDSNEVFWSCLLQHVHEDDWVRPPGTALDVGCHRGGLLLRILRRWQFRCVYGIEPIAAARERASTRLSGLAPTIELLDTSGWERLPDGGIDLVTCHEVLYLEPDIGGFMARLHRVLSPVGRAYVVLGCHAENPVWPHWSPVLEAMGHRVYSHRPMDILAAAGAHGLLPSVRPLRTSGWITHDPRLSTFSFPSVADMMNHHFKHKLLFRFMRP
jgi:SAM-dependent methyltransferase